MNKYFVFGLGLYQMLHFPLSQGVSYVGCFRDMENKRDLEHKMPNDAENTNERCAVTCRIKGFKYSGTQAINECYCGNSYGKHGTADNCNFICPTDDEGEQICGGAWANTVYETSGGHYMGCFKDNKKRDMVFIMALDNQNSNDRCAARCRNKGYMYAGTENYRECYCDDSFGTYGKATQCVFKCPGNSNQICGGLFALAVYDVELCGRTWFPIKTKKQILQRIWGGAEAYPNSFPWHVILYTDNLWHACSGSIISRDWILSAAHCTSKIVWAVAGDHNIRTEEKISEQRIQIVQRHNHPSYVGPNNALNDLVLYRVKIPFEFDDYVQPICIPLGAVPFGTDCTLPGWGVTEKSNRTGVPEPKLQQAWFTILTSTECAEYVLRPSARAHTGRNQSMTCAGGLGSNQAGGCAGDSGGGLVCQDKYTQTWFLEGVDSGGPNCKYAFRQRGEVFAQVSRSRDWIEQTTGIRFPEINYTLPAPPYVIARVGYDLVVPCQISAMFGEYDLAHIARVDWRNKSNNVVVFSYSPIQKRRLSATVPGWTEDDYKRYRFQGGLNLTILRFSARDEGAKCCDVFVRIGDRAKKSCHDVNVLMNDEIWPLDEGDEIDEDNPANHLPPDASRLPTSVSLPLMVIGCIGGVMLMIIAVKAVIISTNKNRNTNNTALIVDETQETSIDNHPTEEA